MNETQEHYSHKTTRTETGKSGFADKNALLFLVKKQYHAQLMKILQKG